jgi:hypothetical protein
MIKGRRMAAAPAAPAIAAAPTITPAPSIAAPVIAGTAPAAVIPAVVTATPGPLDFVQAQGRRWVVDAGEELRRGRGLGRGAHRGTAEKRGGGGQRQSKFSHDIILSIQWPPHRADGPSRGGGRISSI